MKTIINTLAAGLLVLAACSEAGHYTVTAGMPDGVNDGDTAVLVNYDNGDTLATAIVGSSQAVLEGEVNGSLMARLLVGGRRFGLVVEPGQIAVTGEGITSGTPLNDRLEAVGERIDSVGSTGDDNAVAKEFFKVYEENRDNAIGTWAFTNYLMYNTFTDAQIDSLLTGAPAGYRELKRVQKAIDFARRAELTAVGAQFTDFTAPDGQHLSDYAGRGQYTLVDFWASWCGPCRAEIPHIKALYDKYRDRMTFVGVAVWDDPADTRGAVKTLGIAWPVIEGAKQWTEATDLYGINGIPHIMLLDPDGKIVARGLTGEAMKQAVDEAMKQ